MLVSLMVRGDGCLEQDGREAWLSPGDWVLKDTTRPYDMKFGAPFTKWVFQLPRAALRQRLGTPEAMTAMRVSGATPVGRLARDYLTGFAALPAQTPRGVQERLAGQALDLIALALTQHAPAQAHQGAHRTLLGVRMRSFIEQHLHQADLNGTLIAAAFRMSARSVREVFASHGSTPGRYILARRLERARLLLADPDNHWRGISEIGYAAGFADASHFSRSFRSAFGHSPREVRELAKRKGSHEREGGECPGS
jgi:AraC-like DNA-binding protein